MPLTDNLVSFWSLDEASGNALDAHGSNTLTDTNTVGSTTGKVNGCRDFESGNQEYFTINDNASLSVGSSINYTIQAWVRLESLTTSYIVSKWVTGSQTEYNLTYQANSGGSTGRFRFSMSPGSPMILSVNADALGAPAVSTWYHILCWQDDSNNEIGIRINDTHLNTASAGGYRTSDGTAPFRIGKSGDATLDSFDGLIDEVGLWKRLLTSGEKTTLYNGGSGLAYPFTVGGTTYNETASGGAKLTGRTKQNENLICQANFERADFHEVSDYDGTFSFVAGKVGTYAIQSIDTGTSWFRLGSQVQQPFATKSIHAQFWFKCDNVAPSGSRWAGFLLNEDDITAEAVLWHIHTNGSIRLRETPLAGGPSTTIATSAAGVIQNGVWHLVTLRGAIVGSQFHWKAEVDGVIVINATFTPARTYTWTPAANFCLVHFGKFAAEAITADGYTYDRIRVTEFYPADYVAGAFVGGVAATNTVFNLSSSGSVRCGGVAYVDGTSTIDYYPSGGILAIGEAVVSVIHTAADSGGALVGGSATTYVARTMAVSGGALCTGTITIANPDIDGGAYVTGSAVVSVQWYLAGSITGTSATSGNIDRLDVLSGTIAGTSTIAGTLSLSPVQIAGAITATSSMTGALSGVGNLAGSITAVSTLTGDIARTKQLAGSCDSVLTTSGSIEVRREMLGQIDGQSSLTGALTFPSLGLVGDIAAAASTAGTLHLLRPFAGSIESGLSTAGSLGVARTISGDISATSSTSGLLSSQWALAGSVSSALTTSGTLYLERPLSGSCSATSSMAGELSLTRGLSGSIDATSTTAGTIVNAIGLAGSIDGRSRFDATFYEHLSTSLANYLRERL